MQKVADLHIHTNLSDGTFSPEKIVEYSKAKGLAAIAITDHDTCKGIAPAIMVAKGLGIEVIPGIELSAEMDDRDLHILGYFIDWQNQEFLKKLEHIVHIRKERAKEILKRLKRVNVDLDEGELFKLASCCSVGRLHIAQLLFKKGYVSSISGAFKEYIGDSSPCYVKKFKLSPKEAVDMIKGVGGVAVLAHPKTINTKDRPLEDFVALLVKDGIQGIEAYHSDNTQKDEKKFNDLAEKYNLVMTGGSDCHGFGKKQILIGKVKIPYELVERLKGLK
ncbi:MAG: PHP domain-containing protein [Candidatus Gorgyraea atricola]|nr:PHP domain-containing protein [Candidatus Gorgyraea atricola]